MVSFEKKKEMERQLKNDIMSGRIIQPGWVTMSMIYAKEEE